ncbi:hypothetical protein Tco_0624720 [Tanacetum coccineum]|uniref:Uncharacterized protein n=1 Tax=Tanacetum coccineum TaxID=301880 RepID=A0ABQ4WET4_9ASTR
MGSSALKKIARVQEGVKGFHGSKGEFMIARGGSGNLEGPEGALELWGWVWGWYGASEDEGGVEGGGRVVGVGGR